MRLPKFISRYPKTYIIFTDGATRAAQKRSGLVAGAGLRRGFATQDLVESGHSHPATHEEEQNATFNWQWGDLQPWAELPLPGSLRRFRYLMDEGQVGALAGIWM